MKKPWLEQYDEWVPASIDYPRIPLDHMLAEAAAKHPDHTATIFGSVVGSRVLDATISYAEINTAVNRLAAGLQQLGIQPGDRVMVMLPNSPQFVIAAYAIWRIGAILVCCNPIYVSREIEHLLKDSESKMMIVLSSFYKRVQVIRSNTKLEGVIVTNIKEYFPGLLRFLFSVTRERKEGHQIDLTGERETYWLQDIMAQSPAIPQEVTIEPENTSTLIYTGGTTGIPKGVELTHFNLVSNATALSIWGKIREAKDIMIAVMPYFHSYGMTAAMNVAIKNALTIILIPDPRNLVHVLASIQKHKATYYPGVPTMFVNLNNYKDRDKFDLSSLIGAFSAAAPLPPEVQSRFEEVTGGRLLEAYGLTETSPAVTGDPMGHPRANSIGLPFPDTDVRIVDVETGTRELAVGEAGEIIVKGPQIMTRYWRMPTETANALRKGPDGEAKWFFTGDIGYMDEEGFFHISDRKKDMIIAGGYNIYPAEVEAILFENPQIKEAAVIGVPDPVRGETIKAFVVLKEGATISDEQIIAYCRERLAPYKIPRQVEFRDELPKSLVGKVLRRELREEET